MFVVDTNVLVYAANLDARERAICMARLEQWQRQHTAWYLTWGIVYEFCRVVTHGRALKHPLTASEAWSFVSAVMAAPGVRVLTHGPSHLAIAAALATEVSLLRGNLVFDAHTVALMREHGIRRIWTRDADFYRFPGIEVLDPLREDI